MPKKLLWKIFPVYLSINLFFIILISWLFIHSYENFHIKNKKKELHIASELLKEKIDKTLLSNPKKLNKFLKEQEKLFKLKIKISDFRGKNLANSLKNANIQEEYFFLPEIQKIIKGKEITAGQRYDNEQAETLVCFARGLNCGKQAYILSLSSSMKGFEDESFALKIRIILIFIAFNLISFLIFFCFFKYIGKYFELISKQINSFRKSKNKIFFSQSDYLEFSNLSLSLNEMSKEISLYIDSIVNKKQEYEVLFSSIRDAIIAFDDDLKVFNANKYALELFERNLDFSCGRTIVELLRNIDLKNFLEKSQKQNIYQEEEICLYQGMKKMIFKASSMPIVDSNRHAVGTILILKDITRLILLENNKKNFVANASHELKTPITVIKGFIETLKNGAINDRHDAQKFVNIIDKQTTRLVNIIEDLLSLAKIEEDEKKDIDLELASINTIIENVILNVQKFLSDDFVINFISQKNFKGFVNPNLLERAISNILENAIHYSRKETKQVDITLMQKNKETIIKIKDYGIGILEKDKEKIFERFYRVDKARSRKSGGTGLGLSITKHIIEAHKGKILLESKKGEGTTFIIIIPSSLR